MRTALVIAAILGAVAIGVVVAMRFSQHAEDDQKAVTIQATYTKTECTAQSPVKVTVENTSEHTLKAMSYDLEVYLDGDSTNLSGADAPQTWTKIVRPHSTSTICLALPREARDRIARAAGRRAYTVRAQGHVASFYGDGEYVPPDAPDAAAPTGKSR